jgi:D-alanyl-lipoteichoic acid acyltransferase DltB (MBOAT superfamily)
MGFGAPERFDAPWRSASPADFWRRWNIYLGQWFRRYVFNPVSYRIARYRRVPAPARSVAALLITFALAGAAHDAVWLVQDGQAGHGLLAFGMAAVAVLLCEARPVQAASRGVHGAAARWASRALSWHLVFATVWLFGFMVPR